MVKQLAPGAEVRVDLQKRMLMPIGLRIGSMMLAFTSTHASYPNGPSHSDDAGSVTVWAADPREDDAWLASAGFVEASKREAPRKSARLSVRDASQAQSSMQRGSARL